MVCPPMNESITREAVSKWARVGFALAFLALLVSGWLSYDNIRRIGRNDALIIHTHEVLDEIRDLLKNLAEAEANQRNYLLTGESGYLQPYLAAASSADHHLARLRKLTVDNRLQQNRLTNLKPMIGRRLVSLRTAIGIREPAELCEVAPPTPVVPAASLPAARRILLVEDHEQTRLTLVQLLERRGHTVSAVGNIAAAKEAAAAGVFDLVISDLGLPDGDGYELMAELSTALRLPGIALSGYGMDDDIARSRKAVFSCT